ncbi:MAG: right-handed parallel beta-helix repeat-containing protein [Thermodesulfobacteriota bacterium]
MTLLLLAGLSVAGMAHGAHYADGDGDQDVDGRDLATFAQMFQAGQYGPADVVGFAGLFGRIGVTFPGSTYYIDFENGQDAAEGTSPSKAFRHAPGDPNATGNPAKVVLQPGDTVLFKGNVPYRGQVLIPADGEVDEPITYKGDGWPGLEGTRAIIDGGDLVTGWQPCESAAECGGNPNFVHLYYADIPAAGVSPFTVNLHELDPLTGADEFRWQAQEPNPGDPYFMDNRFEFIPVTQAQLTRTSITDAGYFAQADPEYWQGSYLMIWVNPNIVVIREILAFDPASHTVYFEDLGENAIYPDGRDQSYAIYNSLHALDYPGEYVVGPATGGVRRVYLWPGDPAGLAVRVSRSVRGFGIDIQQHSDITIEGFEIRKHAGENTRQGVAVGTLNAAYLPNNRIVIRNNRITHNAYSGTGNSRVGYGGIYLQNVRESRVENNQVEWNPRHRGIFLSGGVENSVVRGNTILRPGSTGITLYTAHDCRIIGNTIAESNGSHANGITLYMGCRNILVAGNTVLDSGSPLTFEDSGNLFFINNIIDGHHAGSNVNEWGDTTHGPWERGVIAFYHNVMVRNSRNAALNIGQVPEENTYIVKHNIFDGGASAAGIDRSHNIYTGLCWNQEARYGWYLGEGEQVVEDLSLIFMDAENLDFHLLPGSPAINAGADINGLFPADVFPGFDFSLDKDGAPRSQWDLGVYRY